MRRNARAGIAHLDKVAAVITIFLAGAELAGAKPAECIGVEDAASGVEAIKAAHIPAIAIGDAEVLAQADRVLADTSDLSLAVLRDTWEKATANG